MVLGVSFDSLAANATFADKEGFPFALLSDLDRSVGVAYGAAEDATAKSAARTGVVINPEGRIAFWKGRVEAARFPQQALDVVTAG